MKRLVDIQKRLKANKGQYNNFGKYAYRSCEDILESVKPLLSEHNLALIISDDVEVVGERYYIKATASLIDAETGTLLAQNHAYAREEDNKKGMDASQVSGATSSYCRKYALNGLFAIDDNKDADTEVYQETKKNAQIKQKKSDIKAFKDLIYRKGVSEEQLCGVYKVKSVEDMTDAQIANATEKLAKKADVIQ